MNADGGLRFSLARLLAAIVVIAAGLAAMVNATPLWANLAFSTAAVVLGIALVAVVYRHESARAYWIGFSVFAWGYLALTSGWPWGTDSLVTSNLLGYFHRQISRVDPPRSANSSILWIRSDERFWLDGQDVTRQEVQKHLQAMTLSPNSRPLFVYDDRTSVYGYWHLFPAAATVGATYSGSMPRRPNWQHFQHAGHALIALIVAFLGGIIARILFATQKRGPRDERRLL